VFLVRVESNQNDAVLLLEGDEVARNVLSQALLECRYKVLSAGDSLSAVILAADYPGLIHAFVADLSADEDVQKVLAAIRSLHPNIKVLLTAADRGPVLRNQLLAPVVCLEKPFSAGLLADTMEAMLKTGDTPQDRR
jgi:CheY-like chemotaxis protein